MILVRLKELLSRLFTALAIVVLGYFQIAHVILSLIAFQPRLAFDTVQMVKAVFSREAIGPSEVLLIGNSVGPLIGVLLFSLLIGDSPRKRRWLNLVTVLFAVFYLFTAVLLVGRVVTAEALDSFLLWHNRDDSLRTLLVFVRQDPFVSALVVAAICLYIHGFLLLSRRVANRSHPSDWGISFRLLVTASCFLIVFGQFHAANGFYNLAEEIRQPQSEARALYNGYFRDSIERGNRRPTGLGEQKTEKNLFVFQLESLNAELVNQSITPELMKIAGESGVLFPRIQSGSVLTILSMETILCSTLPTLGKNLAQSPDFFKGLGCLPGLMKRLGYKTLYFQNYPDLKFQNMESFFKNIGFDELHSADIMQPNDKRLGWGYAEDVFYKRVFDFLSPLQGKRIFAYILVGATNHYPFYGDETKAVYPEHLADFPFPAAANLRERVSNTTYLQDFFFGKMYRDRFSKEFAKNSDAFVLGDHSTPIEEHRGNTLFLSGAYQENFVTSLAFLPANNEISRRRYVRGKRVEGLYSYLDILPTILDLYGIQKHGYYGSSFAEELQTDHQATKRRCIVSVQPFSGGAISIINYPLKHVYNFRHGKMSTYDLKTDPNELNKLEETSIDPTKLQVLDRCLRSIERAE